MGISRGTAFPDSKVNGANMGPTWVRQDPGGPHVDSMNLDIWAFEVLYNVIIYQDLSNSKDLIGSNSFIFFIKPFCIKQKLVIRLL